MSGLVFFDTNVILCSDDQANEAKRIRSIELITEHQRAQSLTVSLQVLQEYFVAATRKLSVDPAFAQRKVELLAFAHVVRFAAEDIVAAIELHRLSQISFWDAMIVHAARVSGCKELLTEDLQHNAVIAGVRIRNPFL